jgi:CelD/BcsL family acetyltransferase involved in cellulose biosynthesis
METVITERPNPRSQSNTVIRQASPHEVLFWDDRVGRFKNHRVTHTLAWVRSLEATGSGTPLFLIFEKDSEVVGCLPGLVRRWGFLRLFGSPLPGWQTASMGPTFDKDRVTTQELVTALVPYLEGRHGIHHIEMVAGDLDPVPMQELGFWSEPVLTYRAPLFPADEGRTLKALKDSARRNVRRAAKLGLSVRFDDDERFVEECYDQIKEVFTRGGNAVPFGQKRVLEFFRHMKAAGNLLAVCVYLSDGRTCIATGTFTIEGKELLLWQWTHRGRYRWFRPTEFMTWTVMQKAMAAGCDTFDLMGRGDFKAKFGAELDSSKLRWVRSRHKCLTRARSLAKVGYKWQQSVRGRLARLWRRCRGGEPSASGAEVE